MSKIVTRLKNHLPPSVFKTRCATHACKIDLQGLPNHVIVNGDKCGEFCQPGNKAPSCDCIIFICEKQKLTIALIELKTKGSELRDPQHYIDKMCGSISNVCYLLDYAGINPACIQVQCLFEVLAKKRWDASAKRKIAHESFFACGQGPFRIFTDGCGCRLADRLSDAVLISLC